MGQEEKPVITQAMIEAYDEYTHLTLDRRGFMRKLTALAGSGAAAAAVAPMLAASSAKAQTVAPDDPRIAAVWVTFPGASGEMKAYAAQPAEGDGPWPGVVVIHENRGLNAHIEDIVRRLALEGFVALAPDFLSPAGGTPPDEDQARTMIRDLDAETTLANAVAAADWLSQREDVNGQVGAIGFCWGGGLVNRLAVAAPQSLEAVVSYYGAQPEPARVGGIEAAVMLHYAGLDERINAGIDAYRAALEEAGVEHEIFVYEGVNHAFNNDTAEARYDAQAAELAWRRTIDFLKAHLTE